MLGCPPCPQQQRQQQQLSLADCRAYLNLSSELGGQQLLLLQAMLCLPQPVHCTPWSRLATPLLSPAAWTTAAPL